MDLIEHIEKHLGQISSGWDEDKDDASLQVIQFDNCPEKGLRTFLSLGLSHHILHLSESKEVRLELLVTCYMDEPYSHLVELILSLCKSILSKHRAFRRGEVIRLSDAIKGNTGIDALYCAIPVYFEDSFSVYGESKPKTVFVWVVPVKEKEAKFIETKGWESFEDILEAKQPDLFDLGRRSVI